MSTIHVAHSSFTSPDRPAALVSPRRGLLPVARRSGAGITSGYKHEHSTARHHTRHHDHREMAAHPLLISQLQTNESHHAGGLVSIRGSERLID